VIAHMTWPARTFINTAWRCASATRTRAALPVRLAVCGRSTSEVIALHRARKSLTLAYAHYVNLFTNTKNRNSHLIAFLHFRVFNTELAQELQRGEIVAFEM